MYPTTDYIAAMSEMQDLAMREMRKILKMANAGNKGANMPVIREKIKIFALLENRLRGTVPVRVQRDNRHVHVHTTTENVGHEAAPKSLDEINREIKRIERTVKEATKTPGEKSNVNSEGVLNMEDNSAAKKTVSSDE